MNTPTTSHRIPSRIVAPLLPLALAGLPLSAFAQGLPTMEDPSRGQGSGILQTLQNYGYDIVLLIALLVVASMFVGVCYHAYTRYSEIHTGRAHENTPAPTEETKPAEEPITYHHVAIPEIHLKRKRKPRYNVKRAWTMLKSIVRTHFL